MLGCIALFWLAAAPPEAAPSGDGFVKPVSLHALTTSSVIVDFETKAPVRACVRVAPAKEFREEGEQLHHRIALTGLPPGARVEYAVEAGSARARGSFWTASAPEDPAPFVFAVVGDSRDHARWAAISRAVLQKHPRFVITTGDNVEADDPEDWRDYYRAAQELFAEVPLFAAIGNHDKGEQFSLSLIHI